MEVDIQVSLYQPKTGRKNPRNIRYSEYHKMHVIISSDFLCFDILGLIISCKFSNSRDDKTCVKIQKQSMLL